MSIKETLKNNKLSITPCREDMLAVFLNSGSAISAQDIEAELTNSYDRVTVYRTLKTFVKKDLIHKVLDDSGFIKYALCSDSDNLQEHNHEHVHFKCIQCGETNCMEGMKIPRLKLPSGYAFVKSDFLIQGICRKCNYRTNK